MPNTKIRPIQASDIARLKVIINATGLFPADMLDDMIASYLAEQSSDMWLTYDDGKPQAIAYRAPEQMTVGTWNLYLIAVHPEQQSKGIGAALLKHIEQLLSSQGQRVLLVETSGDEAFERTRAFYLNNNYDEEARIREFYQAGEDKVVFRKAL